MVELLQGEASRVNRLLKQCETHDDMLRHQGVARYLDTLIDALNIKVGNSPDAGRNSTTGY